MRVHPRAFHWNRRPALQTPWSKTVIYETHVRGFTIRPNSGVESPGTYKGLVEKIPYLKGLGITAVELMPVQEFNENSNKPRSSRHRCFARELLGIQSSGLLCAQSHLLQFGRRRAAEARIQGNGSGVSQRRHRSDPRRRFQSHGGGNELGPTLCFRGIDNAIFYMLAGDKRYYRDYTGTGNTVNANHPVVRDYIIGALRYWVVEMHVDGFRFDLASVLGRDENGALLADAPLLTRIAEDPILRDVKLIAEAWDAAGAYQVGSFSERRWAEWNGRYRDDVRCFWRGDDGMLGIFASRICGSSDIYSKSGKGPESSINFVTCHDGFTLNDLVSYRYKHNEVNGESNRDGTSNNLSDNYGVEGETSDAGIEAVRQRQIKNFLLTLLISRGVPMLLGGDEFRRTQRGNNNAYCQDNDISWFDWTYLSGHDDIYRFARGLIEFRAAHPILSEERFYTDATIRWLGADGGLPNWSDPKQRALGCWIPENGQDSLCLLFHAGVTELGFRLPGLPEGVHWYLAADTSRATSRDMSPGAEVRLDDIESYCLQARSSVILLARKPGA